MKKRVAILISGNGSNMVELVQSMGSAHPGIAALVLSNNPDALGLSRAEKLGVPIASLDHRPFDEDRAAYDVALHEFLSGHDIDFICLAGFMRILTGKFVSLWEQKIINVHPSLLPKYKGLKTHQRAIDAGDREAGCSVHLVASELDSGPLLGQARVKIFENDTASLLGQRVLIQEHRLYPLVLKRFLSGERNLLFLAD